MSLGSGNVSNVLGLGSVSTSSSPIAADLVIAEANAQGYFALYHTYIGSTNYFASLMKNGAIYQVPSGKTCKVVHILAFTQSGAGPFQLVHSMSPISTIGGLSASITSGTYMGGAANSFPLQTTAGNTWISLGVTYEFPSLSYPGIQGGSFTANSILICKEV